MAVFIPEREEKVVISVRLPQKLLETAQITAQRTGISCNEFLNQCIAFAVSQMKLP